MDGLKESKKAKFSNPELVVVAVLLLGGDTAPVDLEDIAMKVNELAPERFAWRKFPGQVNLKCVEDSLWDAKKAKNGAYVLRSSKEEWLLTAAGLAFAREHVHQLQGANVSRKPISSKDRNWMRRERERMLASEAHQKFSVGEGDKITTQEAQAFFRVDAYVTGTARSEKLLRASNVFGEDLELGPLIKQLLPKIEQGTP